MSHAGCLIGSRADRLDLRTMLTRKSQHRTQAMLMRQASMCGN
jgi:hypothetical protein